MFYLLEHKDSFSSNQKKNLVVFTAINSKKVLFRDLNIESQEELNCIVDMSNAFLPEGDERIYPLILKIRNGEIVEAAYQSPESEVDIFKMIKL